MPGSQDSSVSRQIPALEQQGGRASDVNELDVIRHSSHHVRRPSPDRSDTSVSGRRAYRLAANILIGRDDVVPFPGTARPKLRLIWQVVSGLSWVFAVVGWCGSGYFKVRGIGVPMSLKACCWALVGSASMGTVAVVPVNRTWLRVSVARCSSRPRKLW